MDYTFRIKPWWIDEVNPEFKKELKKLDENLLVFRDKREHDWVVVRTDKYGRQHPVGHYQALDSRVFKSLSEGDLWKTTPKKLDDIIRAEERKRELDKKNSIHEHNMEFAARAYVETGIREHKTQF